ncbi:MAG: dethiobiotin synthase [Planctomycetes bacterium]|jgi:dethiobiotin synthetase|nr:dethiobiotin synthase [Planctomycetota bacterium]
MSGARIVLVTGTDTGVGKTVVAAALARTLVARGLRVVAVKPVESGCAVPPGEGEDGVVLARATGQAEPVAALDRLRAPLAPPLAAEREGVVLDVDSWRARIEDLAQRADIVLVEGAGGLLSPLTWELTALDLARDLGAAALVVAADRLGTISHARLVLGALRAAGIPVLGVIFSAPCAPDDSTGTNAAALARVEPGTRIASLPRLAGPGEADRHLAEVDSWILA